MTSNDVSKLLERNQRDRSLREFAKEVGCSASYLSEIYRGTRQPGKKIMAYLGLSKRRTVDTEFFVEKKARRA